ncbi:MAG: carboxypeptidase regulatory-like domain-containing protein, partial [Streptosporangiaceae bacterium]
MFRSIRLVCLAALLACFALAAAAQTASAGAVLGSVTDSSGAFIPGAQLELKNAATNLALSQSTNANGGYNFTNVEPGAYTLTVTATGFQKRVITGLAVEVNKTVTINARLTVGQQTQTVEVTADSQADLQTEDATVGNVIGQDSIDKLPTVQHDTVELLGLQPGVLGSGSGTRVNGAIDDQNTIKLDGVDISGHVLAGAGTSVEALPTPVDSVEEFRVGVANNNASFDSSSGGNITLVGRRGGNDLHGAAYFYDQNQHFNANSWTNNRQAIPITPFTDNRFGARLGGPIRKDKDFYFFNYEGRRFPATTTV